MEGSGLSAKQRRAIELLAQGATRKEAARQKRLSNDVSGVESDLDIFQIVRSLANFCELTSSRTREETRNKTGTKVIQKCARFLGSAGDKERDGIYVHR